MACRKTHGLFSVRNWSICSLLTGALFITLAIVIPHVINNIVNEKLCDQICIPRSTDDATTRGNWLNNSNTDINPEEIYRYYIYNITNTYEMYTYGAYPIVTQIGPYAYQLYREKFNVSYNEDESEIAYEYREKYTFRSDLSVDPVTKQQYDNQHDMIISVNIPCLASWYLIQTSDFPWPVKEVSLLTIDSQCGTVNEEGIKAGCLFAKRPAHDVIFYQPSPLIESADKTFFKDDYTITMLTPIFNHATNEESAHAMRFQHNFGLGGAYKPRDAQLNLTILGTYTLRHQAAYPGNDSDVRIRQLTGHGTLSDVSLTTTYLGNSTFDFWVNPVKVQGHDSFQVKPFLDESDEIHIFDGQVYRDVKLDYQGKTSYRDIEMNHYYVNNVFDGWDQTYDGPNITGLFNGTRIGYIRFGVPSPLYISRPFFAGVQNHQWIENITCTNCPKFDINNYDTEQYNIVIDIEPTTGKVLRGRKRVQTNVLLGDPEIFSPNITSLVNRWDKIPKSFVPIMWFEYSAEMDLGQADMVKSGLSQIHMARTASAALLYGGAIGGSLLVVLAIGLFIHYRRLVKQQAEDIHEHEPMMNVAGPGDEPYTSTHVYRQQ